MTARARSFAVIALTLLGMSLALTAPPLHAAEDQAAEEDSDVTLEEVVNDVIIGHSADGVYLNFEPFGTLELPRIMLARTAEGALTLDAYGSTKSLLTKGPYGLAAHTDDEGEAGQGVATTEETELQAAIAGKEHLHRPVTRAEGHVVVDFSITRHLVLGLLAMAIVLGIFITLAQRYKNGPGRMEAPKGIFQNMMEVMVVFVRDEIARPNIGEEKYRTFLPYLLSAFFFILVANILGLVPYAGSATSNIAVTGVLAVMTFVIGLLYGSKDHYREIFLGPPDAPWWIRPILVPIELIGLVMRHLALAIRLFANMMGGSLIIFSLIGLVFIMNTLFGEAWAWGSSIISIGFTVFIFLLKLLVAFIQAYVFTILSALFIGMSVEEHHEDDEHEAVAEPDADVATSVHGDGALEERLDAVEREAAEPAPAH